MPLRKQQINVNLAKGIDVGTDPQVMQDGNLQVVNGEITRQGAITKRDGYTPKTIGANSDIIGSYKDKPFTIGGGDAKIYNGASVGTGTFSSIKNLTIGTSEFQPLPNNNRDGRHYDYAEAGDIYSYIVNDGTLRSFNKNTNLLLDSATLTNFGTHARLVSGDDSISFYWVDNAANLRYGYINTTNGTITEVGIPGGAIAGLANGMIDADYIGGANSRVLVAYRRGAGGTAVACNNIGTTTWTAFVNAGGVNAVHYSVFKFDSPTDTAGCVMVCDNATVTAIGYDDEVNVEFDNGAGGWLTVDNAGGPGFGAIANAFWGATGVQTNGSTTTGSIFVCRKATIIPHPHIYQAAMTIAGGAAPYTATMTTPIAARYYFCYLASKGFADSNDNYCFIYPRVGNDLITHLEVHGYSNGLCGKVGNGWYVTRPGFTNITGTAQSYISGVENPSSNKFVSCCGLIHGSAVEGEGSELSGCAKITFETNTPDVVPVETESGTLIPGAMPYLYDGNQIVEQGFLQGPGFGSSAALPYTTTTATSAATMTSALGIDAGTYSYVACYKWYDSNGRIYRSSFTDPLTVVIAAGLKKTTLSMYPCEQSLKNDICIECYRTLADGSIYYKVDETYAPPAFWSGFVTFTDNLRDASISSNEQIYTTGGVLEHVQPPPYDSAIAARDRLFYVDKMKQSTDIRYTEQMLQDEGLAHNEIYNARVPAAGGNIKALAEHLGRIVVFKKNSIYSFSGTGLSRSGTGSGFGGSQILSQSVGCDNQKLLAIIPQGIIFKADKGIYLLDRGFNLTFVGAKIRYYTENKTVSKVIVSDKNNSVIFFCSDGDALVYNYIYSQWTTWDTACNNVTDATVASNGAIWAKQAASTNLWAQNFGNYRDNTTAYSLKIVTPWFSFAGIGNFAKLYKAQLQGYKLTDFTLSVKIGYDFDPSWAHAVTQDVGATGTAIENFDYDDYFGAGLTHSTYGDETMLLDLPDPRKKITSIRYEFKDTSPASTYEGWSVTGLTFNMASRQRVYTPKVKKGVG